MTLKKKGGGGKEKSKPQLQYVTYSVAQQQCSKYHNTVVVGLFCFFFGGEGVF